MAEPKDLPDALREAVDRTVQATLGTRERAQGAVDDLSSSAAELRREAERNISKSRRSVLSAVEERLPASQDDLKAIRAELRRLSLRLDALEAAPAKAAPKAKPAAKRARASAAPSGTRAKAKAKGTSAARRRPKPK